MNREERATLVLRLAQPGDTLTHTRCMGCLEEHVFLGLTSSGTAMRGWATADTRRLEPGYVQLEVDDIAPANVTHINRVPVDAIEMLAPGWSAQMSGIRQEALAKAGQGGRGPRRSGR